ncbi:MAG: enoyl-CoA hydratase-related protein, partial [Acidimicrobiales bacterium]
GSPPAPPTGPVPAGQRGLLPEHAVPIVGAVNGPAVTGGLELALGCDFLVASEQARFADTHARVGAMPGAGLTIRLPQLVGIDRARRMSLTGDFVDARTAYEWGLVTEVVPHERLLSRARELASAVASIPAANVREVRRMYTEIGGLAGTEAWDRERELAEGWMAARFDSARLAAEREVIMARGRERTTEA